MSKRNNFAGGLLVGSVVGGLVGTFVGIVLGSRSSDYMAKDNNQSSDNLPVSDYSNQLETVNNPPVSLEAKIAELNTAIDDMRHKLNLVHNIKETDTQ